MSEAQAAVDGAAAAPAARGGKSRLLIVALALLVIAGGTGGAWYAGLFGQHGGEDAPRPVQGPPLYFDVDSNLIVNFEGGGRMRYLQLGVQVMTRDPATIEALKVHHPVIRNNLILLFSEQTYETLSSREGKQKLSDAALEEVRKILREQNGNASVEALYFTTFVMQ
jgi:flagellar FliL protein